MHDYENNGELKKENTSVAANQSKKEDKTENLAQTKNASCPRPKASKYGIRVSATFLAKVAMLTALGVVLLYIEFPLFPAVPWLKLNFSDCPTLMASFMFGPVTGIFVNAFKILICLLLRGTSTNFVGDLSNLVSGSLYAATAGIIYMRKKNKTSAVLALAISSAIFCLSMWVCNQFFLLPLFGLTESSVMYPALLWTLLFNVIKTVLTSLLTFFIYKKGHTLFNKIK